MQLRFDGTENKGEEVSCFVARFFVLLVFDVGSDSLDIGGNFFVVESECFGNLLFELGVVFSILSKVVLDIDPFLSSRCAFLDVRLER